MRTKIDSLWTANAPARVEKLGHCIRNPVTSHQDGQIVVNRDQSTIEHPVHRTAQCDPVAHRVRAAVGDWPNMRGLDLRSASTIDDLQAGNRTSVLISCFDSHSESSIAERSCFEPLNDRPIE